MIDTDAFLTALYVHVDDFFQQQNPVGASRPGPAAPLTASEVVTLALFGQWAGFGGERGYWRWAGRHLREAFPKLPARRQVNRQVRGVRDHLEAFAVHLAARLGAPAAAYQAMDLSAAPTRDAKRRGGGWWVVLVSTHACPRF